MKKILFVINNLEIGGVPISLSNMLKFIGNQYDITVLVFYKHENSLKLPGYVKVINSSSLFKYLGMSQKDTKNNIFDYVLRAIFVVLTQFLYRSTIIKFMSLTYKKIYGYDYVVSFLQEGNKHKLYGGCNEFVLENVIAKHTIAWIHSDFEKAGADFKLSKRIYEKFDKIITCSEGCKEVFMRCFPEFEDKTYTIRNFEDYDNIIAKAGDGIDYENNYLNVVTVARLAPEKGILRALKCIKNIADKGYRIKYHIIGDGIEYGKIKNYIFENNMDHIVILYGKQVNPYKYIKKADLFFLPSYHEAAPMVFDEASCLKVPILTTRTTSVDEMIIRPKYGFVCENSEKGIEEMLLYILQNPDCLGDIREILHKQEFNNNDSLMKIKKMFS